MHVSVANERCGTWYVHPSKIHRPGVYFKSTDGHTGRWDFNLRRYNPHLITAIINHGGCIVVDSTRKGKRIPDALSKTIPIWCATINNAIRKRALQHQEAEQQSNMSGVQSEGVTNTSALTASTSPGPAQTPMNSNGSVLETSLSVPSLDSGRWDTRYHSLPSLISRSEHMQITEKIDEFSEKLLRFTDLTPLATRLFKPIRPIWLTPQSFLLKDQLPDYSQVAFFPVICLSASRVVPDGLEECDGYLYVQGSGDDEEMWSKGLTPDLFWENEDYLLEEGITATECETRAQEVVREAKRKQLEKVRVQHDERGGSNRPVFTPSMEIRSEIKPSPIWIGNNASGRLPDTWEEGFDIVINCAAEIKRDDMFEAVEGSQTVTPLGGAGAGGIQASLCIVQRQHWRPADLDPSPSVPDLPSGVSNDKEYCYLHLPIAEGKKGQHQLLEMIPIAIKAVKSIYDSRTDHETSSAKILIHCQQGMDRSVGIALALLVSCFDEETGRYCGGNSDKPQTKEVIQRRLFQIMSHRLAARPSRATLKMVNTYFMSPIDPPPAKYKPSS